MLALMVGEFQPCLVLSHGLPLTEFIIERVIRL